jgi:hypothetical protein
MCGNDIPEAELEKKNAKKWNAREGVRGISVWHGVCKSASDIWAIEEKDVGVICVAEEGNIALGP